MASHLNPQLSRENLLLIADEYRSFSQVMVGIVSLAAGIIALVLHLSGYEISGVELLLLVLAPIFVATVLGLGKYFGISRRLRNLEAPAAP